MSDFSTATPPRRRWFRFAFSLRTLFVVVTIFGVWLGWNLKIVRERKAIIEEVKLASGENFSCMPVAAIETDGLGELNDFHYSRISVVRRLLGDESYFLITVPQFDNIQLYGRMESAFAESKLFVYEPITPSSSRIVAFRDSLTKPLGDRQPNRGTIFKTGLIEK